MIVFKLKFLTAPVIATLITLSALSQPSGSAPIHSASLAAVDCAPAATASSSKPVATKPAPKPKPKVPTPAPDPISTPLVTIEGPATSQSTFMVVLRFREDVNRDTDVTLTGSLPSEPTYKLNLDGGDQAWYFHEPKVVGDYVIAGRVQIETAKRDPVEDFRLVVKVGHGPQPPPVVVDPVVPPVVPPVTPIPVVGTAATYVYELRDDGAAPIPSAVLAGLNRLNREKKIVATLFEQPPAGSEIPEQYKAAYAAAKAKGLPALVVTNNGTAVNVVLNPTTEEQVWGAVQ